MIHTLASGIQHAAARIDPNLELYVQMLNMGLSDAQIIADDLVDLFPDFFYIKRALGKDARPIDVYKVRTMRKNADQELIQLLETNGIDELGKINEDPRITRLGEFLRGKSLDEIPNLVNLARGELMIVGPRPRTTQDWLAYPAEHRDICLQVKPGCLPAIYADLPQSIEEQIKSNERFVERYLEDPIATTIDYTRRASWNLARKKVKNR